VTVSSSDTLSIDVVSDAVCPWCFVGKRHLEAALAASPAQLRAAGIAVRWHPFELNPDLPREGIDRRAYLEAKFGGAARASEIYQRVSDAGRRAGIEFAFDRIERQPNTRDAHRLVAWAQAAQGDASPLVEALFRAYFLDGRFIGERDELAAIAGTAGFDRDDARAHLESDAGAAEIAAAEQRAARLGITGVPFFIFDGRLAVSGAQPPDALVDAMLQASRERA
jgi:predicted DsbA family dithiol-disulfide isomerase